MIGIDITTISRFKNKDEKFTKKILGKNELKEFDVCTYKAKFLATRWAIKEAIYKTNNNYSTFNTIDIIKNNNRYSFENYIISTSCENDILIAIVQQGEKNDS